MPVQLSRSKGDVALSATLARGRRWRDARRRRGRKRNYRTPPYASGGGIRWVRCIHVLVAAICIWPIGDLALYRDAMAFSIHALYVAIVVALLAGISRGSGGARSSQASSQQTSTGPDNCAASAAQSRACRCPQRRSYRGAACSTGYRCLIRTHAPGLFISELSAIVIVVAELFEASARARQGHHAGSCRHTRTTDE